MQCEKFQELILTNYLDNETTAEQRWEIESHLAACPHCREFAKNAKIAVIDPFEQLERIEPSARLWQNIKEAIKEGPNIIPAEPVDFWEKLKPWFLSPKPAFAMVTVAIMIIMGLTVLSKQGDQNGIAQIDTEEQIEYLVSLIEDTDNMDPDENRGYGTAIEEYFL